MEWSLDGQEWRQSPVDFVAWMGRPPFVSGLAGPDINEILLSEDAPPFARELLQEAWSEENKNPRSALVIGIAALETGIKDLIIGLIPETEWLIRNLQSPPVHRMLGEYLPLLQRTLATVHVYQFKMTYPERRDIVGVLRFKKA
jgi:hypothetical protein